MRRRGLPEALLIAAMQTALCARAATSANLPGIGMDGRREVNVDQPPWRIIGRLQAGGTMRCTAFLVAPSVIETAAHCLYIARTGHFWPASDVHFLLGYDRGQYRAHAVARRYLIPTGYVPSDPSRNPAADHATVVLDHPIADKADLLPIGRARPGKPVALAGYEQDRGERALADTHCHILDVSLASSSVGGQARIVRHDCAGTRGVSGAPLLSKGTDGWAVVGLATLAVSGKGGYAVALSGIVRANRGASPPAR